jgi:3-keto-5-aminohexanoate cleavage enzyme
MQKIIVQAVLNEGVRPAEVPNVPISPAEVTRDTRAALGAGASVIHFHGRDPSGGQAPDDVDYYVRALRGLDGLESLNWYPPQGFGTSAPARWSFLRPVQEAVGMNLISIDPHLFDMMDVDRGSGQIKLPRLTELHSSDSAGDAMSPLEQWLWFCAEARRLSLTPLFGVFEPGGIRKIVTWYRQGLIDGPVILNLFLTDRFHFGLPPQPESLDILRRMIPDDVPYEWFCCPIGVSADTERGLREHAIRTGGHLRVGLGSPPLDGLPTEETNASVVARAVELVERLGAVPADAEDARSILGAARASVAVGTR